MLPAALKNYRAKLGISQKEAAAQIGIPRRTYSDYERGTSVPKLANYNKLQNWLSRDTADGDLDCNDVANIVQELHSEIEKKLSDIESILKHGDTTKRTLFMRKAACALPILLLLFFLFRAIL